MHRASRQGMQNFFSRVLASELLREGMQQPRFLTEIADLVGVHPAHLSKEFRRWFGCTPGEYLRGIRIEAAKQKL